MAMKKGPRGSRQLGEMHEKGTAPKNARKPEAKPGQAWWKLPEDQVPGALMSTIRHIQQNQTSVEQETLALSRLYGGRLPGSAYGTPHHAMRGMHPSLAGRLTYNMIAIVIDALESKITKESLSTQYITNGGDYRQQRRAKKLSQFTDGINYETKMDEKGPDAFRDGTLSPFGAVHTYPDWNTGRVRSERVMAHELFVDYADGFYGDPAADASGQDGRPRGPARDRVGEERQGRPQGDQGLPRHGPARVLRRVPGAERHDRGGRVLAPALRRRQQWRAEQRRPARRLHLQRDPDAGGRTTVDEDALPVLVLPLEEGHRRLSTASRSAAT
jgi:hypothetical protein